MTFKKRIENLEEKHKPSEMVLTRFTPAGPWKLTQHEDVFYTDEELDNLEKQGWKIQKIQVEYVNKTID